MGLRCIIIGAGNLATHLGTILHKKGFQIVQVYSQSELSAHRLAGKFGSAYTTFFGRIFTDADVYFIVLKDSTFGEVLPLIDFKNKLLIHCSGSLPMDVLKPYSENYGVLYPLQTFSKTREIVFTEIPVFIEANSDLNLAIIKGIAEKLSKDVRTANSGQRLSMHIAAVFACNFVNHLYAIAGSILEKKGIDFEVLRPLILETAEKIKEMSPKEAQTGPAVRFDKTIIEKHIKYLSDRPELCDLYKTISKSIFEFHKNSGNDIK